MAEMNTPEITTVDADEIKQVCDSLFNGVSEIIDSARRHVAVYVNAQSSMMFWHIGYYIIEDLNYVKYSAYGEKILATLSQKLTAAYGKGFSYSALTRMMRVASFYKDESMFATLSQTLSWSYFLELITIEDNVKRLSYQQMGLVEHWSVRTLREKQDSMAYERSLIATVTLYPYRQGIQEKRIIIKSFSNIYNQ